MTRFWQNVMVIAAGVVTLCGTNIGSDEPDNHEQTEVPPFQTELSPEDGPEYLPETHSRGNDCFQRGNIRDFEPLDRNHLVVFAPSKKQPYLLEVSRACIGLRFAETIAFQSRDRRICPFGGDDILIDGERCSIWSITRLDEVGYELVRARFKQKSK